LRSYRSDALGGYPGGGQDRDPYRGKPKLVTVQSVTDVNEVTFLRLTASLERGSEHPLAAAIVKGAEERGVKLTEAQNFEYLTDKGVTGEVDGHRVALGNRRLLADLKIAAEEYGPGGFPAHRRPDRDVRGA
jgi:cation transport ATPase